jgi:uncharacterized protein YdaU (DUF1376 family)
VAKDPAFLFYPGDWLGGTMGLSRLEKGAYMDLLMGQFNKGRLSMKQIKRILGEDFKQTWKVLSDKFKEDDDGFYYNVRLEFEINKRKRYSDSRRKNRAGTTDKEQQPNDDENKPIPPTEEEVLEACREKNYPVIRGKKFFKHYDSIGWLAGGGTVGRVIVNWKSKLDEWMLNDFMDEVPERNKGPAEKIYNLINP